METKRKSVVLVLNYVHHWVIKKAAPPRAFTLNLRLLSNGVLFYYLKMFLNIHIVTEAMPHLALDH